MYIQYHFSTVECNEMTVHRICLSFTRNCDLTVLSDHTLSHEYKLVLLGCLYNKLLSSSFSFQLNKLIHPLVLSLNPALTHTHSYSVVLAKAERSSMLWAVQIRAKVQRVIRWGNKCFQQTAFDTQKCGRGDIKDLYF